MDNIKYNTTKQGFAEVEVNGEKVRCRSFKMVHEVDCAPVVTIEFVAPIARINAICDLVSREYKGEDGK